MVQLATSKIVKQGAFLIVNACDVAEYVAQGWTVDDAAEAPAAEHPKTEPEAPPNAAVETTQAAAVAEQPSDGFEDMKVAELRKIADDLSIQHDGLKKSELIEAIRAVRDGG